MLNYLVILIFLLLSFISLSFSAQWLVNTSPNAYEITSIKWLDSNNCIGLGTKYVLLSYTIAFFHSSDKG